jgi:molybdopterin molybdotransferase
MGLFLQVIPVEEAITRITSIAPPKKREVVPLEDAFGRILAEDARSDIDIPGFTRSIVDGYAVVAGDTHGASDSIPAMLELEGRIAMGGSTAGRLQRGRCMYIPTGGALPDGADAVVMIEYSEQMGDQVLVNRPVAAGENVLAKGEDFRAGEVVLEAGKRLGPQELGVLAAIGYSRASVAEKPVIGIVSTGIELVPVADVPKAGQVRDVNAHLCGGFVRECGGIPRHYGIVRDDPGVLEQVLTNAVAECDAILVSGGSSKDERDIVASVIERRGRVLVHGIALQPGKPTIIGTAGDVPVIGLPGHPASAFVVLQVIVRPLLALMTGEREKRCIVQARLAQNVPSSKGREEYVRVTVSGGWATPLFGKSGLLNTLVRSSGMIRIPAGSEGFETGEEVEVILW